MTKITFLKKIITVVALLLTTAVGNNLKAQWVQKPDIFVFYPGFALGQAFVLDDKIYVGGGWQTQKVNGNELYEYTPSNDQWQVKGSLPKNVATRSGGVSFTINNKAYVGLGAENFNQVGSVFLNDLWEYDAANNSWIQKASLPSDGRASAAFFVAGGKAYVIGGRWFTSSLQNKYSNEVWEYDPSSDKWTKKADFPEGDIALAAATGVSGKGYILGGSIKSGSSSDNVKNVYEYNPASDKWTKKASTPEATGATAGMAFTVDNIAYYGLGFTDLNMIKGTTKFYSYNPATDAWKLISDFPADPRGQGVAVAVGGKAYIGGGFGGGKFYRDWYELTTPAGVNELFSFDEKVVCAPNPTTGIINLKGLGDGNTAYAVYNMIGVKVAQGNIHNKGSIDITSMPAGQYIVELKNNNETVRKNIVLIK